MPTSVDDQILEELQRIRTLLTPAPAPPPPKGLKNEFMTFLSKYKVLGLAVGFIMGLYLGNVVQALATGLIIPGISYILGPSTSPQLVFGKFQVGVFLGALITFVIVAFVIFLIVKIAASWHLD